MPISKPVNVPFYKPRLPIGSGSGPRVIDHRQQGGGLMDIAKVLQDRRDRKRQQEMEERKMVLAESLGKARIGALGAKGQRTTADVIKDMSSLPVLDNPDLYPAEAQMLEQRKQALLEEYGALTNQSIENVPATPGTAAVPASGQWNPFKENIEEIPAVAPTPATQRLVPKGVEGPPAPTKVAPGLDSIAKSRYTEEGPPSPKTVKKVEKPAKAKPSEGEPKSEQDFMAKVADLKATDMKAAKAYYDKWVKKWQ